MNFTHLQPMRHLTLLLILIFPNLGKSQRSLYISAGPELRFRSRTPLEKSIEFTGKLPTGSFTQNNSFWGSNTALGLWMGTTLSLGKHRKDPSRKTEFFLQMGVGYFAGNSAYGSGTHQYTNIGDTLFSTVYNTDYRIDTVYNKNMDVQIRSDQLRAEFGAFVRLKTNRRFSTTFGTGLQVGYSFNSESTISSNTNQNLMYTWLNGNEATSSIVVSGYYYETETYRTEAVSAIGMFASMRLEFNVGKPSEVPTRSDRLYLEFRPQSTVEQYGNTFSATHSGAQVLMGFISSF